MNMVSNNRHKTAQRLALPALTLGHIAQALTFTAFTPALSLIAKTFNAHGKGMIVAQQSVTIAAAGLIIGGFLSGRIVERYGARRTVLTSLAGFGVFGAGGIFLNSALILLASRVFVGFFASCLVTACVSAIAAMYDGNARAKVIGIAAAMGSAASIIGYVAGGALTEAAGWRAAFIQFPAFALLGLILAFAGIRGIQITSQPDAIAENNVSAKLWPLYLLTVVISAVMFMGSTQFAFLLPQDGITTATGISYILSTITVVATVVSFGFGMIERQLGLQGALVAGFTSCAIGMTLIGTVATPLGACLGAAFIGGYVGNVMPYIYHAVTVKTTPATRVRAIGHLTVFNFTGGFINPFIFAPISERFGLYHLFLIIGIFMALLAAGAIVRQAILRKAGKPKMSNAHSV